MHGKKNANLAAKQNGYYVVNARKPDGKRTTVCFGRIGDRPEPEVMEAFAKWVSLLQHAPHQALACRNPYQAIKTAGVAVTGIRTVGQLYDAYLQAVKGLKPVSQGNRI